LRSIPLFWPFSSFGLYIICYPFWRWEKKRIGESVGSLHNCLHLIGCVGWGGGERRRVFFYLVSSPNERRADFEDVRIRTRVEDWKATRQSKDTETIFFLPFVVRALFPYSDRGWEEGNIKHLKKVYTQRNDQWLTQRKEKSLQSNIAQWEVYMPCRVSRHLNSNELFFF
jgi:hypothetical protein